MSITSDEVIKGLNLLFTDGDIVELRAFRKNSNSTFPTTLSGFFDDFALLTQAIDEINESCVTTYVTLNPIAKSWQRVSNVVYCGAAPLKDALLAAGEDQSKSPLLNVRKSLHSGEVFYALRTTDDCDIASRRWILIDVDAGQPVGTNSNDEEKAKAKEMALAVRDHLVSLGFPEPALCDSGNGYHLLVRVALDNSEENTTLVRHFLFALNKQFAGKFGTAHLDRSVFNAGRITKCYGSVAFKGEETDTRPHRRSSILSSGDPTPASIALIESVASLRAEQLAENTVESHFIPFEEQEKKLEILKKYLTRNGVEFSSAYTSKGSICLPIACPNGNEHTMSGAPTETICTVRSNGAFGFDCKHEHCTHLDWYGFRTMLDEAYAQEHPDAKAFNWSSGLVANLVVGQKSAPEDKTESHILPAFARPRVLGSEYDFVLAPQEGSSDGWFPRGAVSIVGGASGSGKSTLIFDVLERQRRGERIFGHETFGLSFLVAMADRGAFSNTRTLERMRIDRAGFPICPIVADSIPMMLKEVQQMVEASKEIPQVLFIESADMLIDDATKIRNVAPLLRQLSRLAEWYHIAVILSIGAPKMKPKEVYTAKRDSIFGSVAWGRMSETIAVLQYPQGDDMSQLRELSVLLRNAKAEAFRLTWMNGRLVEAFAAMDKPVNFNSWVFSQNGRFTRQDAVKGTGLALNTVKAKIGGLLTADLLKEEPVGKNNQFQYRVIEKVQAGAAQ
jgi:hypothetical protein